jgi:hypothetical protein
MQGASWVALLRRIPAILHDSIIIVTSNGAEIVPQAIVRLEREYVVIRGRMAGSQDTGRLMFVPYDQMNYVGLTKKLTDAETQLLLGKPGVTVQLVENGEATAGTPFEETPWPTAAPEEEVPPPAEEAASAPTQPVAKPPQQSKSVLLARLRARLATEGAKLPGELPGAVVPEGTRPRVATEGPKPPDA